MAAIESQPTVKEDEATRHLTTVAENLKECFGDDVEEVRSLIKDAIVNSISDSTVNNNRLLLLQHIRDIITTIEEYELTDEEDLLDIVDKDELLEDRFKSRLKKIFNLSFRHLILVIAANGGGTLEHHNLEELADTVLYSIYVDKLNVAKLMVHLDNKLKDLPYPERRYLDSNIISSFSIDAIIVGVVISLNKYLDLLAKDIEIEKKDEFRNKELKEILKKVKR